jgi:hypothetical protein
MNTTDKQHRAILQSIARRAMLERSLPPDFSAEALAELGRIQAPAVAMNGESIREMPLIFRTGNISYRSTPLSGGG